MIHRAELQVERSRRRNSRKGSHAVKSIHLIKIHKNAQITSKKSDRIEKRKKVEEPEKSSLFEKICCVLPPASARPSIFSSFALSPYCCSRRCQLSCLEIFFFFYFLAKNRLGLSSTSKKKWNKIIDLCVFDNFFYFFALKVFFWGIA